MISCSHKRRYKRSVWCQTVQILDWELTQHYCGSEGCKPTMDCRLKSMSGLWLVISWEDQSDWGMIYQFPPLCLRQLCVPIMVSTLMSCRRWYFLREIEIWSLKSLKIIPRPLPASDLSHFLVKFLFLSASWHFIQHISLPIHDYWRLTVTVAHLLLYFTQTKMLVGDWNFYLVDQGFFFLNEWMTLCKEPKVSKW